MTCEQTAEAVRLMDADEQASPNRLPAEAGNVWFAGRPDRGNESDDWEPVTLTPLNVACMGVVCAVSIGIWCVGLGVVAGYVWTRWLADPLLRMAGWALLS